jgi:hypothetical protein
VFRQARARLAGEPIVEPDAAERRRVYAALVEASVGARGEHAGVASAKRHLGVLGPLVPTMRPRLVRARTLVEALDALAS